MEAEIKTTVEKQKRLEALSRKPDLSDSEKAELLADIHEWFYMVWKKLPDFSKKSHRYQLDALENIVKGLGGSVRKDPEPKPDEDED